MSQQRNSAADDEAILDAAHELLLAIGVRRMTMADIARRAGVSRATMYRRWPNVTAVVAALMTREFGAVAVSLADATSIATAVVDVVARVRVHPLLRKIVDVDPEMLLPYLFVRRGRTTDLQLDLLESAVARGVEQGSVRAGDPAMLARAILLTAWSFVLTGPVLTDDHAALDAELSELLERYLRP